MAINVSLDSAPTFAAFEPNLVPYEVCHFATRLIFIYLFIFLQILDFLQASFRIVKLVLRNNALTTLHGIENLKSLEGLDLSYNIISSFVELEILANLSRLQSLWLEGNPICYARWYRAHVFSFFPHPEKVIT